MSLPTELSVSIQFGCELGANSVADSRPNSSHDDHAATVSTASSIMESLYDLAGELRGLGPQAHTLLKGSHPLSLRQRMEGILSAIEDLQADLAEVRGPVLHKQLRALGIDVHSRNLQLHIGCGGHVLPGWINLDNYPAPLATNLAWGLPLPNECASFVFLSHLLEHLFYPNESNRLLEEIHRTLQPGGVVRIVVPDIEQCLHAYINEDSEFFAARREHWHWLPKGMTRLESFLAYAGAGPTPEHLFEHHKFGYDFETLSRALQRAGFTAIKRCEYQQSAHPVLRVDHASSNATATHGGKSYSLFVEAVKGRG